MHDNLRKSVFAPAVLNKYKSISGFVKKQKILKRRFKEHTFFSILKRLEKKKN